MKIFPVVHIVDSNVNIAARESNRAFEAGADGIYLIDHHGQNANKRPLLETFYTVKNESPDRYVGLNILGASPLEAVRAIVRSIARSKGLLPQPSGLWIDDMREDGINRNSAIEFRNSHPSINQMKLLGGVAFKYTETYTEDPDLAFYETEWLKDSVDSIVTSGSATGKEPTTEKLIAMKQSAENKPLVVASGISIDNIEKFDGIVDQVLVSSSIETYPGSGKFEKSKLKALIEVAHSLAK